MKYRRLRTMLSVFLLISMVICFNPVVTASASEIGTVNTTVILRESSTKNSTALQTLPEGEEVSVLRTSGDWYRVRYGNFTGYIMKKYISMSTGSVMSNQEAIDDLGNAPGPLYIGDEGSDVKKLQEALKILGYYSMRIDGVYGNGTTTAVALFQQSSDLEADGIAGKYTIRAIFGSCASTSDITVSGRETAETDEDTAAKTKASDDDQNVVESFSKIGSAPDPTKEGDSGTDVIKLQQALYLLGYYTGVIDGDYGTKTTAAVTRFQKNRGMSEDGIAGSSTIRVLFSGTAKTSASSSSSSSSSSTSSSSSSSTTYETLVLDWFKDNVTSVIPKNAKFTIKDVRTGKTFKAIRWSGTNHLDAEPATSEDTAIYKTIYRGTWSWNRRPILILYRGKVYAASMNGMPHGTTTIDDNDYEGHFCIHFLNSKTHETAVVDSDHQDAVAYASKATW